MPRSRRATDCSRFNVATTQQLGEEAIGYAHAVKIEALAQLGAMLKGMEKNKGGGEKGVGRAGKNAVPQENHIIAPPTLEELGIDKKTSMIAQRLATMPEDVREVNAKREITPKKRGAVTNTKAPHPQM